MRTTGHRQPGRGASRTDPDRALAWFEQLLTEIGAVRAGKTWQCPAHDGTTPALRVARGDRGVLVHCRAGCPLDRVLARLALHRRHLVHPPPGSPARFRLARLSHLVLPPMREQAVQGGTPPAVTAHAWFLGLLDAVGSGPVGGKVRQCPAHADAAPSLSVDAGDDGRVLVRCHAGCSYRAVLDALALPAGRLYRPAPITPAQHAATFCAGLTFPPLEVRGGGHPAARGMRLEAEHPYGSPPCAWLLRYRHPVTGAKACEWESLNPHGERVPGLLGTPARDLPLYRERDVLMGAAVGETVLLVESESSVDDLRGLYATTWAGGASSPALARIARVLGDADVVIVPDHDDAGLACLDRLADALPHARVLLGEPGEDARDLYRRIGALGFAHLVGAARPFPNVPRAA